MNPSKIEKIIDELYDYVDSCKPTKFYPDKITVEKGEMYDLLDELRLSAPEEIRRYQKVINNRDNILNQAKEQAEAMLGEAEQRTAQILDENEIVQTAYQRADDIMNTAAAEAQQMLDNAMAESEQIRKSALAYTNDLLAEATAHVEEALRETEEKQRMLTSALKSSIQIMTNNRQEVMAQLEPAKQANAGKTEEEFEVPEEAFVEKAQRD